MTLLDKLLQLLVAVAVFAAVVGVVLVVANRARGRRSDLVSGLAFTAPAVGLLLVGLLYPAGRTAVQSFLDASSASFVGLDNYVRMFTQPDLVVVLRNTLLWVVITPILSTAIGLVYAVLVDRTRFESLAKALIFLPMAISFVGASAIWLLVYSYRTPNAGVKQNGLLNAIWTSLGNEPVAWLQENSLRLNSILMMVILIWLQVGFAMILLSSAIKGVPEDTLEAARIDGASELQIFWSVVIPQIKGTIITVFITVLILVLKVFDIVYVLTDGRDNSNVIANLFFTELFARSEAGRASAIVVVLLIAVTPVLIYQVRHFRREEASS